MSRTIHYFYFFNIWQPVANSHERTYNTYLSNLRSILLKCVYKVLLYTPSNWSNKNKWLQLYLQCYRGKASTELQFTYNRRYSMAQPVKQCSMDRYTITRRYNGGIKPFHQFSSGLHSGRIAHPFIIVAKSTRETRITAFS